MVLYGLVYFGLVYTKLAVEEFFGLGLGFIQDPFRGYLGLDWG